MEVTAKNGQFDWFNICSNCGLFQIDIAFEEDKGFLAAIVALTRVAKRPIILTSNDPNITLPTDSEFLILKFKPPKMEVRNYVWQLFSSQLTILEALLTVNLLNLDRTNTIINKLTF